MIKARIVKAVVMTLPTMMLAVGGAGTALTVNGIFSAPAYAADKKGEKQISTKVGKPLKEALDLAQQKKFKEAMAKAREVQAMPGKTAYEEYKINEIVAYIAVNLQDAATATKAWEATLDSGELSPAEMKQRLDQLTKVYYGAKNYPKAIQFGTRYAKEVGPDTEVALLVVQSYYLQQDYPKAIESAQALIRTANQGGQTVKKEWLDLLMDSQMKAGREADAQATLEQLVAKYPSPVYWNNMFILVQNQGGSSDRKSLEVYRLKMLTDSLKESEYVEMAELALSLGFPGDARTVLEKGFANKSLGTGKNSERQSRLLNLAKDNSAKDQKGLAQFEKEAVAASNGEADLKLGEAYLSYGENDKAIEAIKRAIKKGGLKSADEAQLQLGIAYFNAKRSSDAIAAFKAVPSDSKLASVARLWIIYASK
jgi:lipopolysaccharide biosynthesis regulator YciM